MKIAILCFGPFGGRSTNGSISVARKLGEYIKDSGHVASVIEVPTNWAALKEIFDEGWLNNHDRVIGLGEGFDHFMSIEQMAVRLASGKDVQKQDPPQDMLPNGPEVLLSGLHWEAGWGDLSALIKRAALPSGSPGLALNGYDGRFLCNAAHYHLLTWRDINDRRKAGFIHLPPLEAWQERTERTVDVYAEVFAMLVMVVLTANGWYR